MVGRRGKQLVDEAASSDEIVGLLAAYDEETARLVKSDAAVERAPPLYRYLGGAAHVPDAYVGQLCIIAGPARRKTSRRVLFRDGWMISVKSGFLEPVAAGRR